MWRGGGGGGGRGVEKVDAFIYFVIVKLGQRARQHFSFCDEMSTSARHMLHYHQHTWEGEPIVRGFED